MARKREMANRDGKAEIDKRARCPLCREPIDYMIPKFDMEVPRSSLRGKKSVRCSEPLCKGDRRGGEAKG